MRFSLCHFDPHVNVSVLSIPDMVNLVVFLRKMSYPLLSPEKTPALQRPMVAVLGNGAETRFWMSVLLLRASIAATGLCYVRFDSRAAHKKRATVDPVLASAVSLTRVRL